MILQQLVNCVILTEKKKFSGENTYISMIQDTSTIIVKYEKTEDGAHAVIKIREDVADQDIYSVINENDPKETVNSKTSKIKDDYGFFKTMKVGKYDVVNLNKNTRDQIERKF